MHAKANLEEDTDGLSSTKPSGKRAAESLSAHARRQAEDTTQAHRAATSQMPTREILTWREEVDIHTEARKTSATVTVHTYVTEDKVSRQIPLMREEASITTEKITPAEAIGMTPREIRGDRKQTFEVELSVQEAVVSKRLVPNERVTVEIRRVTDMVNVDETVKTEHFKVYDLPPRPKGLRVRREGVTNLGEPYGQK